MELQRKGSKHRTVWVNMAAAATGGIVLRNLAALVVAAVLPGRDDDDNDDDDADWGYHPYLCGSIAGKDRCAFFGITPASQMPLRSKG